MFSLAGIIFLPAIILLNVLPFINASQWRTLDYLQSIRGKATVVGVHNKISKTPSSFTDQAIQISGKTPGLWGGDFLFDAESIDNRWKMVEEAKKQWEAGGIISIMWHACNPTLHEPCSWSSHCHGDGPWSDIRDDQWRELITEGTALYNRWVEMMDDISQYLQWLNDEGVEVMFRPLHEMNQGCFWWGGRPGPDGTRRLYQITHDYLMKEKNLKNIIWTWNIQDFGTLSYDAVAYNPGDEYWEIATLDVYEGFTRQKYDIMVDVAGDKPLAIGECWELPTSSRLAEEKQWTFFMSWSELTFQWPNTNAAIRLLYNSEEVITLDAMPGWVQQDEYSAMSHSSTKSSADEASNRESSSNSWSVDYSADGIIVDLGNDHTINRIRLRWEDVLNHTSANNRTTPNGTEGAVANVFVENDPSNIRMDWTSGPSLWELEVSYLQNGNNEAIPQEEVEDTSNGTPTHLPTQAPGNEVYSKAPTKTFFEPMPAVTSNPTTDPLDTYTFLSNHDTYLCAYNGGVGLQASAEQEWEHWNKVTVGDDGMIALRSAYGTYLSAWYDGSVKMAGHIKEWEMWTQVMNDDGTIAFLSHHGNYLSAWPDGIVRLSGENIGWERFREEKVVIYE